MTIQADSFIETEGCDGPRYTRNAPSRENGGVLMTEIQDKYITEFALPYRNIDRYIKEIKNNWNRLDENSRNKIKKSFEEMNLNVVENFGNSGDEIYNFINYLGSNPSNVNLFMDILWKSSPNQNGINYENLLQTREIMYQWSVDNFYALHCNWKSGLILFFLLLLIIILIIVICVNGNKKLQQGFGRKI